MDTKKLRQKILDLAIHGKLVPQDPNDEPASVLLERIRAEKERLIKEGKIKKSKASKTSDTPHYEQVPFEVPSSWEWTTLENILELVSGQDFPPEKYNANVSGIPYIIGASNIDNEQLVINRWTEYPSVYSYLNDLLVVCKGAGIGKMAINNIGTVHIARQIQAVRVYTNYINIRYIKAVIKNNIENIISKANGLIPGLKRELLLSLQIPLPPFPEQQRIVAEIEKWFALIDIIENGKMDLQTTIKQAKSKILDLAIHGKLVPQDPNDEPATELLKRINPKAEITCDNGQYGKIPDGWCLCRLGDIGEIVTGNTPTKDIAEYYGGNIPFYKPADLEEGKFIKNASDNLSVLGFEQARRIPANSILVTCIGATIGKTGLIIVEGSCNQQINAIIPNEAAYAEFIYYTCISDYMQKEIKSNASATTLPILNKGNFAKLPFPLPPLAEQQHIVTKIEELFTSLDNIQKALEV